MNESAAAIKHRKPVKVGKLIVTLLTLFSLVGIASTPASAAFNDTDPLSPAWTFTVTVSGEEPVDDCEPEYGVATWEPDETLSIAGNDFNWATPGGINFYAFLNFSAGVDPNDCFEGGGYDALAVATLTGTVTASLELDPELEQEELWCDEDDELVGSCSARDFWDPERQSLFGSISVKPGTEAGPYSGTLTVVWAP
jgi:hypothetical protein